MQIYEKYYCISICNECRFFVTFAFSLELICQNDLHFSAMRQKLKNTTDVNADYKR